MLQLKINDGVVKYSKNVDGGGTIVGNTLSVSTGVTINLFKAISVVKGDLVLNEMGLYSHGSIGPNSEVTFGSLTLPRWILKARGKGCVWDPYTKMNLNTDSFKIYPVQYQGEECPDILWNTCFEKLMGVGNEINNLNRGEVSILFQMMLSNIYEGLGNSLYDMAWFGLHPSIAQAETNQSYTLDDQDWEAFKKNQGVFGGWLTILDKYADEGKPGYDVHIADADFRGTTFIGRVSGPSGLFDRLLTARSSKAKLMDKKMPSKSPILVTPSIFKKYKEELLQDHSTLPEVLYYKLNGEFCKKYGCVGNEMARGVLMYDGHPVVEMDCWESYDAILGSISHRAVCAVQGSFGFAYDVPALKQFQGLGLRVNQKLEAPYLGKVFMDTNFRFGVGIVDDELVTNASVIVFPDDNDLIS